MNQDCKLDNKYGVLKYDSELNFSLDTALTLIAKRIKPNSRVLEFGPATGYMTKYFKEELKCEIVAVELDPDSARLTAPYCKKMIIGDIDRYPWRDELKDYKFDHIIFSDVLEHLYDPWAALSKAASLLDTEGTMLTSIPNVGHSAVIMNLLNGVFDYHSLGLMDKTHIRFFTRKSVLNLLEQANLKPIEWLTTRCAPENSEFKNYYQNFSEPVQSALKNRLDAEVYQFIAVSKYQPFEKQQRVPVDVISSPTLSFDLARFSIWFLDSNYKLVSDRTEVLLKGENVWTKYKIEMTKPFRFDHLGLAPSDQPAVCSLRNVTLYFDGGVKAILPWDKMRMKKCLALTSEDQDSIHFVNFGKTTLEFEAALLPQANLTSVEFEMRINRNLVELNGILNEALDSVSALAHVTIKDILDDSDKKSQRISELNAQIYQSQNTGIIKRVFRKIKSVLIR